MEIADLVVVVLLAIWYLRIDCDGSLVVEIVIGSDSKASVIEAFERFVRRHLKYMDN